MMINLDVRKFFQELTVTNLATRKTFGVKNADTRSIYGISVTFLLHQLWSTVKPVFI